MNKKHTIKKRGGRETYKWGLNQEEARSSINSSTTSSLRHRRRPQIGGTKTKIRKKNNRKQEKI